MEITIGDLKLNYIECGKGPDVLMLHGWGASADSFKSIIGALQDKCHIIALDFPGCGKSDLPKKPLDINDYVFLVLEFCSKVGLQDPILIGHSHGCRVIMKMCGTGLMNPPKIVFIDGAGLKPRFSLKKSVKIATFKTVRKIFELPIFGEKGKQVVTKARSHFGSADYSSAPEVMRKTMVKLVNDDMTPYVPEITASTLLIWGENDTATPLYMAKKIEKMIKDCGLCVIKDAGHWSFAEKPVEVNAILRSFIP